MRITVDASPLLVRSAGVKNYLHHWIRSLRALTPVETFPFSSRTGALDHEHSAASRWRTLAGLALLHLLNRSRLPWRSRADVFHASTLLRNPPRGAVLTTTLHDLTCWLTPELHTPANVAALRVFAERVAKRAAGCIAVSECTRQDAIRILGLAPERVTTIYSGVPEEFFDAQPTPAPRPYLLFVGTIEPRKNVGTLLDAYAAIPDPGCDLLIAGPAGWRDRETMARLVSPPRGVRYLGYVPEADLPGLTAGATAFVYPSLYEGFGFPVAQAMAAGVPVITSNVSSLPEVAAGAALLVDPQSQEQLCAAIERLLASSDLRKQLSAEGRRQAQRYRWEVCARQSLDFFERTLGQA